MQWYLKHCWTSKLEPIISCSMIIYRRFQNSVMWNLTLSCPESELFLMRQKRWLHIHTYIYIYIYNVNSHEAPFYEWAYRNPNFQACIIIQHSHPSLMRFYPFLKIYHGVNKYLGSLCGSMFRIHTFRIATYWVSFTPNFVLRFLTVHYHWYSDFIFG